MRDITERLEVDWDGVATVTLPLGRRLPTWLSEGDVLFAAKGNRNYAALVDEVPGKSVCTPTFFHIRVDTRLALPGFVAAYINAGPGRDYIESVAEGSRIRNVRKSVLAAMPIDPPPLDQQQRLVELQALIEEEANVLRRMIANRREILSAALEGLT
ncbi:MAG: hypothetical protein WBW88_10120, partial [Rhodothermales bacterium]